ncbi:hypothetical protein [Desertivirga brevis]|uniref:hypothetical protein n=1 Tax=Desertivirga brevis TaxID=2810310 RepID=UPI001A958FFB|nr:hypothetical protein [Pedobacter sp. SYSU D00873]
MQSNEIYHQYLNQCRKGISLTTRLQVSHHLLIDDIGTSTYLFYYEELAFVYLKLIILIARSERGEYDDKEPFMLAKYEKSVFKLPYAINFFESNREFLIGWFNAFPHKHVFTFDFNYLEMTLNFLEKAVLLYEEELLNRISLPSS